MNEIKEEKRYFMFVNRKIQFCRNVKTKMVLKLIYRFNATSISQIPSSRFVDIDKLIHMFIQKQKTQNSQQNTDEEEQRQKTDTTHLTSRLAICDWQCGVGERSDAKMTRTETQPHKYSQLTKEQWSRDGAKYTLWVWTAL